MQLLAHQINDYGATCDHLPFAATAAAKKKANKTKTLGNASCYRTFLYIIIAMVASTLVLVGGGLLAGAVQTDELHMNKQTKKTRRALSGKHSDKFLDKREEESAKPETVMEEPSVEDEPVAVRVVEAKASAQVSVTAAAGDKQAAAVEVNSASKVIMMPAAAEVPVPVVNALSVGSEDDDPDSAKVKDAKLTIYVKNPGSDDDNGLIKKVGEFETSVTVEELRTFIKEKGKNLGIYITDSPHDRMLLFDGKKLNDDQKLAALSDGPKIELELRCHGSGAVGFLGYDTTAGGFLLALVIVVILLIIVGLSELIKALKQQLREAVPWS